MTTEFRLPDLGEDTTEGDVVQILVAVGDVVTADQPVIELETDKALLEVPAPVAGRITKIHVAAGATIHVAELIVTIEETDAAPADPPAKSAKEEQTPAKIVPQTPKPPEPEPPRQPATPPPRAPETVTPDPVAPSAEVVEVASGIRASASPSTRRLARELGVDLARVKGSGTAGRISNEDVESFVRANMSGATSRPAGRAPQSPSGPSVAPPLPDFSQWGDIERRKLSRIRKKTIEAMTRSWSLIPHVTQMDEADITELQSLRERHADQAAQKGGKLTPTVFVLKAIVSALKAFPQFNASLDVESGEVVLKSYYHIGIAVDTEHGLLVPVIRDVDKKDVMDLSAELATISDRARKRKLGLDEMRGATFTLTNLGGLGGAMFTPIINHPEVAILGLARTQKKLVMTESGIVTRPMLPLCLSYDHRIIDGADAVRFTRKMAEMIEDPALLLLT